MADPLIIDIRKNHRIRFATTRTLWDFSHVSAAVITDHLAVKSDKGLAHPIPVENQFVTPVAALNKPIGVKCQLHFVPFVHVNRILNTPNNVKSNVKLP